MIFYINQQYLNYEIGNLFRIFYPYTELTITNETTVNADLSVVSNEEKAEIFVKSTGEKFVLDLTNCQTKNEKEYIVTSNIYKIFEKNTSYSPKWGMLTGIHPVKLFSEYEKKSNLQNAKETFKNKFFVSNEKINLSEEILDIQRPYLKKDGEKVYSIYISIPFCPSRCSYCSFVSQSVEKSKKLIEPYFNLLLEEVKHTSSIVSKLNLTLKSVYIGGGTPTTLSANQIRVLIDTVKENFDMSSCTEFTVEAGRPDTIDKEKLESIKNANIDRISINPQSLQDNVLEMVGRKHSSKDIIDTYYLAREIGIKNINMDLIAGLKGDTLESFKDTLDKIIYLNPENITIHSLALKRSANIFTQEDTQSYHSKSDSVTQMVDYSIEKLKENAYIPYYLYRQSRMAGNAENTGWAKKDSICAYNIYTMDESHTVIACGAGGVSKIVDPYSNRLERIFNFKYAYEYINRFDEIIKRKDEVISLYEQFCKRLY
ncbi:MAG: coproporphyrinogen dehydrogenase HemZ [Clostridia bacterium]